MGDLQHFCLRWNNYQSSITSAFENLRDDEDFVDVTLACDGKSLKAHRVVLSACSPYFRELLKSTPCKHPVIVLQDVIFEDLHALVEFIYHGEVNVHQKALPSFLKTAEVLRVSGLTQQSEVREEATEKTKEGPEENWLAYRRTPTTPSYRHRERRPSTSESTENQENNPSKKVKTDINHTDLLCQQLQQPPSVNVNHNDKEEPEPPVDFSTTNSNKTLRKQDSGEVSPSREREWERDRDREKEEPQQQQQQQPKVKSEPAEGGGTGLGGGGEPDDSNESANISEPQIVTTEPDDSTHGSVMQNYFDSKLFAVTGASFNFSMAAALAADSLAGLNNQGHQGNNAVELAGTSQGWGWLPGPAGPDNNNKLVCDICNKSYRTMNSLRNHRSIYHRKYRADTVPLAEPQFTTSKDNKNPYH